MAALAQAQAVKARLRAKYGEFDVDESIQASREERLAQWATLLVEIDAHREELRLKYGEFDIDTELEQSRMSSRTVVER